MPVVGVIGGGQLARMMISARGGFWCIRAAGYLLEGTRGVGAARRDGPVGRITVTRRRCSTSPRVAYAITFDHEASCRRRCLHAARGGVARQVRPGPDALLYAQDKLAMRARLAELVVHHNARLGANGVPFIFFVRAEGAGGCSWPTTGGRAVVKTSARAATTARAWRRRRGMRTRRTDWLESGAGAGGGAGVVPAGSWPKLVARRGRAARCAPWPVVETGAAGRCVCGGVSAPAAAHDGGDRAGGGGDRDGRSRTGARRDGGGARGVELLSRTAGGARAPS